MVSATTCCTWPTSLVMRDSSWPVERRAKKPADWLEHVRVQPVAQVAHDALADVGHQVVGEIPAKPLEQIRADDGDRRLPDLLLPWAGRCRGSP